MRTQCFFSVSSFVVLCSVSSFDVVTTLSTARARPFSLLVSLALNSILPLISLLFILLDCPFCCDSCSVLSRVRRFFPHCVLFYVQFMHFTDLNFKLTFCAGFISSSNSLFNFVVFVVVDAPHSVISRSFLSSSVHRPLVISARIHFVWVGGCAPCQ